MKPSVVHKPFKPFTRPYGIESYVMDDWNKTYPNPNQVNFRDIEFKSLF